MRWKPAQSAMEAEFLTDYAIFARNSTKMTSDHHHSLRGAGRKSEPAPSIPVYSICEVCGQADEKDAMTEGMCRDCIGVVREAMLAEHQRKVGRFDVLTAVVIGFWAAVIMWRWLR